MVDIYPRPVELAYALRGKHLGRGSRGHDAPLVHNDHAVAVAGREIDAMQHHHHGQSGARIPLRYRFHQGHVMRPVEIGVA